MEKLLARSRREVEEGLLPGCQVALALDGEIVVSEAFGEARPDTRFALFSATKALVAGAVWALIGDGKIDVSKPAADYVPSFAANGKDVVTVEQVMLHTAGFPQAPLGPPVWSTREGRLAAFERWRLEWEPGTRYVYHPTSAHWVLAEIIESVTGSDFRDVVATRVTEPAGLPKLLGVTGEEEGAFATLVPVGEHATPDELEATFGVRELPGDPATTEDMLLLFNDPEVRALGVPGGGGVGRAQDLALFYQAVLRNPGEIWHPEVLADAIGRVRNRLPDPLSGAPANRTLGLFQAGDDNFSHVRGLGRGVSPGAVGHNGAGGQLAWGDPETGLSFGYVTNGLDRHETRQPRRGTALGTLAAICTGRGA
ncbi:MAG: beta-lactamase family protein [Myxococcales bacterium]|nr:beta-lactamase family protein [Myxococcales bacterium]